MTATATKPSAAVLAALLAMFALSAATNAFARAAGVIKEEHVTGGVLQQGWENGFGVSNNMQPLTLDPSSPAYANPSGDHTVGVATNSMAPDSGGVILTAIDPNGVADYEWEGWVFTGDGSTRRGLAVRCDPNVVDFNGIPSRFTSSYQFVVQAGLFSIAFRRVVNGAPTTLSVGWNAAQLPAGSLPQNTWHKFKVIASGSAFRCFIDDYEFTSGGAIEDNTLTSGWVGVYNFSAFTGNVPVYFDDLVLSDLATTATTGTSWGDVKARWSK